MNELTSDSPTPIRPPKPPWYRRKRAWLGLVVVLLLGFIGAYYLQLGRGKSLLREVEAELDTKDPNWRMVDLLANLPQMADGENLGGEIYTLASQIPGTFAFDEKLTGQLLDDHLEGLDYRPNRSLPPIALKPYREDVPALQPVLDRVRRLPRLGRGWVIPTVTPDYLFTLMPHVDNGYKLVRLLQHETFRNAEDRNIDGALDSASTIITCARAFSEEPLHGSAVHRRHYRERAVKSIHHAVNMGEASDRTLSKTQALLLAECEENELRNYFRAERAGMHHLVRNLDEGKVPIWVVGFASASKNQRKTPWYGRYVDANAIDGALAYSSIHQRLAEIMRQSTRMLDALEEPYEKQAELAAGIDEATQASPTYSTSFLKQLNDRTRVLAYSRCANVGLAAERFRLQHKRWPKSQDELVPNFLKTPLNDPFDSAKPLSLRHADDGIVVFSVGPKKSNVGTYFDAKPSTPRDAMFEFLEFRIWNPDHRRMTPKEDAADRGN